MHGRTVSTSIERGAISDPMRAIYRPEIDGLRALAVLAVVGFHAFPGQVTGGFVGVDVFFVISGFLISNILVSRLEKDRFSFAEFYLGRIRRIFPALAVVLAVTFALGWYVLLPDDFERLGKHIVGGAAFVSNFTLWSETGYFDVEAASKPLLHLWSLGIEEQFYIAWPALLWLFWRRHVRLASVILLVLLGSFAINVAVAPAHPSAAFYWPVTRFWELMAGSVLAYFSMRATTTSIEIDSTASGRTRIYARTFHELSALSGLGLIVAAILAIKPQTVYSGWWALLPTVGTVLVLLTGHRSRLLRVVLENRWAVGLGLISYPLYLWHWPLMSFVHLSEGGVAPVELRVGIVLLSVSLAWITYRLIEVPIRFGSLRRHAFSVCSSMMATAMALGVFAYVSRGAVFRFPSEIQQIAYYKYDFREIHSEKCGLLEDEPFDGFASSCFAPPAAGKDHLLIWGDSDADRLYPGLFRVLGATTTISRMARVGCAPVLDIGYANCIRSNDYVIGKIRSLPPDVVIMAASWPQLDIDAHEVQQQISATIEELEQAGVDNVVVVGPPPRWTEPLARLVYRYWREHHEVPKRMTIGLNLRTLSVDAKLKLFMHSFSFVSYVSLIDRFCDSNGCLVFVPASASILTTSDREHLTTPAAIYAVRGIKDAGLVR